MPSLSIGRTQVVRLQSLTAWGLIILGLALGVSQGQVHDPTEAENRPGTTRWMDGINGSGTSWLPQTTPMHAWPLTGGGWEAMAHGALWLRYTSQNVNNPDERGSDKLDAPNWLMGMARRNLGSEAHQIQLRAMLSLDFLTLGGEGYPLLFASGETWEGEGLVDRQHPHDLFMELSTLLTHRFSEGHQAFLYLGYPGEPALGPTAFMHRPSALTNPSAVLGHHYQDATHITFGVATLGWMFRNFKIDGSLFTGREPDEDRYDFDEPRFDSYSLRLAYQPLATLSGQVSAGYLAGPEALNPGEDLVRVTSSLVHVLPLGSGATLASSLVQGSNFTVEEEEWLSSVTVETEWVEPWGSLLGRYEILQKATHDLALEEELGHGSFRVQAATLGAAWKPLPMRSPEFLVGMQGTAHFHEEALNPYYGEFPLSFEVFLTLRPGPMSHSAPPARQDASRKRAAPRGGGHEGH